MNVKKILLSAVMLTFILFATGCGKKEFTVQFDSDGGTIFENQKVEKDSLVTKPSNPTKEGYSFLYWELDGSEFDFDTKITKDVTLVAKYEESSGISYTVSFNTDGGSSMSKVTVEENYKLKDLLTPVKNGYKFLYWELDGEEFDMDSLITKNITLKARWEKDDSKPVGGTTKKTTKRTTTKATEQTTTSKPTTTTKAPVTYAVHWVKIGESSLNEYMLYIRSSEGNYVSGKVELTIAGEKHIYDISTAGKKLIKSAVEKAVFISKN